MKRLHTLELSVLRVGTGEGYRAVLWDGWQTRGSDDVVLGVTYTHQNFFVAVRSIKRTVLDWSKRRKIRQIVGVNDGAACWPIDTSIEIERAVQETEGLKSEHIGLGFTGVRLPGGIVTGCLYTKDDHSHPLKEGCEVVGQPLWTGGANLFGVSELLSCSVLTSCFQWGLSKISGFHDEAMCWPECF